MQMNSLFYSLFFKLTQVTSNYNSKCIITVKK